jgi:hypothetical protein
MRLFTTLARTCLMAVLGLAFIHCGGGGSGDKPRGTLALATHTVTFTGTFDDPQAPALQYVDGTITGATATVYLKVLYTNQGLAGANVGLTGATSGQLTLIPKLPSLVGAGTFTDTVTVIASLDQEGNQPLAGSPQVVTVTTVIAPKLSAGGKSLVFNQVAAAPTVSDQAVALAGTAASWQAVADKAWIRIRNASGNGPGNLTLGIDPAGLQAGSYQGVVTVTSADAVHQSVTIPVTLNVLAPAFLADQNGVAFCSMPGVARTSQTLRIRDSFGHPTAWTAQSSQTWLTVTPSGTTPGSLTLQANPANLPADALQTATVTVKGTDPAQLPEVIQVGFWVGASAPAPVTLSESFAALALDPIRPYAYVHYLGESLKVYNIYTGTLVKTLTLPGATLGAMALDSDGSRLFVLDTTTRNVVPVSLPGFTPGAGWPLDKFLWTGCLAFTRLNGLKLLVADSGPVLDATQGSLCGTLPLPPYGRGGRLALSGDGSKLVVQQTGTSPSSISLFTLAYSPDQGGLPVFTAGHSGWSGSNGQDVAMSADGSRVYTACGGTYDFGVWDGSTLAAFPLLPGAPYPNNVAVAPDGRIIAGADSAYGVMDVWVYTPAGALQTTLRVAAPYHNLQAASLRVSGDGQRLAALTAEPTLRFVTLP